jgi:hypothetical protein
MGTLLSFSLSYAGTSSHPAKGTVFVLNIKARTHSGPVVWLLQSLQPKNRFPLELFWCCRGLTLLIHVFFFSDGNGRGFLPSFSIYTGQGPI